MTARLVETRLGLIVTAIVFSQTCFAQPKTIDLDKNTIPSAVHYNDNLMKAIHWTDNNGDNLVILTATLNKARIKTDPTDDSVLDADLQATHYIVSGDSVRQTCDVHETGACPGDFYLYFILNAFAVTDLNNDGYAEIWMMYAASCQVGYSPLVTQLVMYESAKKYTFQGKREVKKSTSGLSESSFTLDDNFRNGEPKYLQYAQQLGRQIKDDN